MTNKERQETLDIKKWFESELAERDLSGFMEWCVKCNHKNENGCTLSQENRQKDYVCAKAYNRMVKNGIHS